MAPQLVFGDLQCLHFMLNTRGTFDCDEGKGHLMVKKNPSSNGAGFDCDHFDLCSHFNIMFRVGFLLLL